MASLPCLESIQSKAIRMEKFEAPLWRLGEGLTWPADRTMRDLLYEIEAGMCGES